MDFRFDSVEKVLATGDRTFVKAPLGGGSSSLLPELYTTGTTKEEKDLKKVNLILLVIIHDRWSSRPTNPMHNDLLIGPTYSLWTLHGFPSALSSRKSSPLHSSIRTFRSLSKNLRMKGPPPDR